MPDPAETVAAYYAAISYREGGAPDWPAFTALFLPDGRLRMTGKPGVTGIYSVTPEELAADFTREAAAAGVRAFSERELRAETLELGDAAQVASWYETRMTTSAGETVIRGAYSFQLLRVDGAWRIAGVAWGAGQVDRP